MSLEMEQAPQKVQENRLPRLTVLVLLGKLGKNNLHIEFTIYLNIIESLCSFQVDNI